MVQNLCKNWPQISKIIGILYTFRQAVKSPKSWNSVGYICLKSTYIHALGWLFSVMRDNSSVLFQSTKFQTFDCSLKISPNLYFDRLLKKYHIVVNKYRGVIFHDTEDWSKIWRKTDLLCQKWQEFGEIWPEHSKVSKTCTFICSIVQNI